MARPERNNVDYFPFDCQEGKKMFYLEETYGNDGFAVFVKLLRELAKTDYHYLDLSKNSTMMFLSAKCKVSKETMEAIINDLVELEKFDLKLWSENRIIWCQDFIDSIQDAYKKRNNKCISYEGLLSLLSSLGILKPSKSKSKGSVNPQSKVKYSKEEETKVKEGIIFPFNTENFIQQWDNWKRYKEKEFKFKYKSVESEQAALKKLGNLSKNNESIAVEIIHQSFANGWKGFFAIKENNNGQITAEQKVRNQYDRIHADLNRERNQQQETK